MIERRKAAVLPYSVWAKAIRSLPTIRTSGRALTLDRNVLVLGEVDASLGHLEEHVLLITIQRPQLVHN